ncbi:hypothetical protein ACHQM5_003791 [Ranunculus cassubicifolius]
MAHIVPYQPFSFASLPQGKYVSAGALIRVNMTHCLQCFRNSTSEYVDPLGQSTPYVKNISTTNIVGSLQSDYKGRTCRKRIDDLKEVVRSILDDHTVGSPATLELIVNLQRLGVGYHFEREIKRKLDLLFIDKDVWIRDDLRSTALYFRLLRQHGFKVSQDLFRGFIDETGSFKTVLCEDVEGILSLYEASHLCVDYEHILHEAKVFTVKHLTHLREDIDPSLLKEISRSLGMPLHWRMPRLDARCYIDAYEKDEKVNLILVELAILDFNMVQATYQKELANLSWWWENLGLSNELTFARDRLVESYVLAVGVAYRPQYQYCREWLTKVVCLILAMDDIYDCYGSLDELVNFTAAVDRWDLEGIEKLPDYMKICFLALFNTTNEIVYMKYKGQRVVVLPYLKKVWTDFCNAMLLEAEWSKTGYMPSLMEYLDNARISSSIYVCLAVAFFATDQAVTTDILESLNNKPDIMYYSSMIVRLCNDLATSSAEMERGDVSASIQCYMNESNSSEQTARTRIHGLVSEMWEKLNKSVLDSPFDDSFVHMAVNIARTAHSIYQHGDGFDAQDLEAKKRVVDLLFKPIDMRTQDLP